MDEDEAKLAGLGLKQEVSRHYNLFTNYAIALSIISFPTGEPVIWHYRYGSAKCCLLLHWAKQDISYMFAHDECARRNHQCLPSLAYSLVVLCITLPVCKLQA